MEEFFSRLSYSLGNEDWRTERRALSIGPEDCVLCITGSGDRSLHVLLEDCKEVISIDANKAQNFLLELKIAALKELDFDNYLSFLGITDDSERLACLDRLATKIHPEASSYWLNNKEMIRKGIIYQGTLERVLRQISRWVRFTRGGKVKKLYEFTQLEEQKEFIRTHWDNYWWKKSLNFFLSPFLIKVFKDPGLFFNVDPSIHVGNYIHQRLHGCLTRFLTKESFLISMLLRGDVPKDALPPYLTKHGTQIIKNRLDRVKVENAEIVSYLESTEENKFDCFSISDVASYLNSEDFNKLAHAIYRTAKPGARFSIRQVMTNHQIPPELEPFFQRDLFLEDLLQQEDRCFIYRFMAGKIIKPTHA
jgi:S-adenosylmethionine-diacylglycerol 3-amino-3-carboxypropyl transferase